jgi:hypothetical protein
LTRLKIERKVLCVFCERESRERYSEKGQGIGEFAVNELGEREASLDSRSG